MAIKETHVFHDNVVTTGSGNIFSIVNANPLSKLYISTSASGIGSVRSFVFEASGMSASGTYFPVTLTNLSTLVTGGSSTSNSAEVWVLNDLGGFSKVRVVINSLSSGSLTITGKHVW